MVKGVQRDVQSNIGVDTDGGRRYGVSGTVGSYSGEFLDCLRVYRRRRSSDLNESTRGGTFLLHKGRTASVQSLRIASCG